MYGDVVVRSKNPANREALLRAATRVFAAQGLSASTASIAKEAGVSAGTLFVYFDTKSALVNDLYVDLKTEMGRVASTALQADASPREQLRGMWDRWVLLATADPDKRRALAHLGVAEELTEESRTSVHGAFGGIAELLRTIVTDGPLRDAPLGFVSDLMSAISDTTIDDLIRNPDPSGARSSLAFDAMWRALAG